jgi:hypothetical protein
MIIADIVERSSAYVPEWRYHQGSPDAGSALVNVWADMLAGTETRLQSLPENNRRAMLDASGLEPLPALPSTGYLVFELPEDDDGLVTAGIAPKGTEVASAEPPEATLATVRDVPLTTARLKAAILTDGASDTARVIEDPHDLIPFAEGEACTHIWTFSHPYAFEVSAGRALRLRPDVRGLSLAELCSEAASWEYLDECGWTSFAALRSDGTDIHLSFPQQKSGICTRIRLLLHSFSTFAQASLAGILAWPEGAELLAEALYVADEQQGTGGFYPFGQQLYPQSTLSVACPEALTKPGARVELAFSFQTEEVPIEGYPDPPIIKKKIMYKEDFEVPLAYEVSIAEVVWEYFNGVGWALLPVDGSSSSALFSGPSPISRVRRLSFICPEDLASVLCGAHDLPFIRARVTSVANLGRTKGHFLVPRIEQLRFRYHYDEGIPLSSASVAEYGETRTVSFSASTPTPTSPPAPALAPTPTPASPPTSTPASTSPPASPSVLPAPPPLLTRLEADPIFYLGFDRPFEDASILFALEHVLDTPPLTWEFYSEAGWRPLDVHDGSKGLAKTGIVVVHTPRPIVASRVMGTEAYFIRLVDVQRRLADGPGQGPHIRGIWLNAVKARALVTGTDSNRAAFAYRNLAVSLPLVSSVYNPLPTHGGSPAEDETEFIERVTVRFNNRGRAVTASDYEQLAQAASRHVLRCACLSNTDEQGAYRLGHSCVVILSRDEMVDDFESLAHEVVTYLEDRRSLAFSGSFSVVAPRFVEVCVKAQLLISDLQDAFVLKQNVLAALKGYLDPRFGGVKGRGFAVGTLPDAHQVEAALKQVSGIVHVASLDLSYLCASAIGPVRRSYANAIRDPFVLPTNGQHDIGLSVDTRGAS